VKSEPAYARSTTALWRRAGGEVLLARPEGSDVDGLSMPASAAWLLLERPLTLSELTGALAHEFSVGREEIAGHVVELVDQLEERGWLVRVSTRE
jgi:hypothetical protein